MRRQGPPPPPRSAEPVHDTVSAKQQTTAPPEPSAATPRAMAKTKHELRQMLAVAQLTRKDCLTKLQALPMSEAEALAWIQGVRHGTQQAAASPEPSGAAQCGEPDAKSAHGST